MIRIRCAELRRHTPWKYISKRNAFSGDFQLASTIVTGSIKRYTNLNREALPELSQNR